MITRKCVILHEPNAKECRWGSGGYFIIKMPSYHQYRKSHCGDKMILCPSFLHNGISNTGKMISLYWISPQDICNTWARFRSLARSKLRLCAANHRPGYWSNLPCDWTSTAWVYSEQETENGPWSWASPYVPEDVQVISIHSPDYRFSHLSFIISWASIDFQWRRG